MLTKETNANAFDLLYSIVSTADPKFKQFKDWYYTICNKLLKWSSTEGNQGTKRMKSILGFMSALALGENPEPLEFVRSSNGIPDLIVPIMPYLQLVGSQNEMGLRRQTIVQSLARLTDFVEGEPFDSDFDKAVKTISTPVKRSVNDFIEGKGRYAHKGFRTFVQEFLKMYKSEPIVKQLERGFNIGKATMEGAIYRESAGPNGPYNRCSDRDLKALFNPVNENLRSSIYDLQAEVCNQAIFKDFGPDGILLGESYDSGISRVSKLTALPQKAGKVRFIAQVDYYTQEVMTPIHNWLMDSLATLPTDCTYDQRRMLESFCSWTGQGDNVYSFDQSSCTDLFPIDTQLVVVEETKSQALAHGIKRVLVDRDFEVTYPSGKLKKVRWNSGQPMGALCSWPLMALTHHLLVHYAYWVSHNKTLPKTLFSKYAILGDDIVIADKHVADAYLKVCKELGMKINLSKSHISSGSNAMSEFAKLLVWRGHLIEVVKPKLLQSAIKDWRNAIPLLIDLKANRFMSLSIRQCEKLITKYFPKGKKVLSYLITVPQEFGGLGFPKGSLKNLTKISNKGSISPLLWYLTLQVRKDEKEKGREMYALESAICDRNMKKVRQYQLQADRTRHLSHPAHDREIKGALQPYMVLREVLNGSQTLKLSEKSNLPFWKQPVWVETKYHRDSVNLWQRAIKLSESYRFTGCDSIFLDKIAVRCQVKTSHGWCNKDLFLDSCIKDLEGKIYSALLRASL